MKKVLNYCFWLTIPVLILYFVLHEFNRNFGLISFSTAGLLYFRYVFLGVIICLLAFLFFRDWKKTFLFCLVCLFFILFFGAMHDGVKHVFGSSFFTSHSFVISLIVLVIISAAMLIKKYAHRLHIVYPFLALVIFFLGFWELSFLTINILKGNRNNLVMKRAGSPGISALMPAQKPDIFFIVFDSYASSEFLRNDLGFDNTSFDSMLLKKGFYISSFSKSNYPITPMSLASTLNMDYLSVEREDKEATARTMLKGANAVYYSLVPELLAKEGYTIYNYSVFDLKNHPAMPRSLFGQLSKRMIDEQTLPGRFQHLLLWNFLVSRNSKGENEIAPSLLRDKESYIVDFIDKKVAGLKAAAGQESENAKFVYCHIMLPHEPFYFNADGSRTKDSVILGNFSDEKQKFINQTIYTNKIIEDILSSIMARRQRPFVIILEGDHGYRDVNSPEEKHKIFQNLNAYYFSDKDYEALYDSISPVNTFRVIWNKYFNGGLKLLPDSSVYIRDPSFKFEH